MLEIAQFPLLAIRMLLAAVFLLAAATKLADPLGLKNALREFGLPHMLARPAILLLPISELSVAAALALTNFAWYGACGAAALLVAFSMAIGIGLIHGRRPACHCFGQLHSARVGWPTLTRNIVLTAFATWIIGQGRLQPEPDLWTWFLSLDIHERKVAIIAGCAATFCFFYILDRARRGSAPESPTLPSTARNPATTPPAPGSASAAVMAPRRAKRFARGMGLPIGAPAPGFELPDITGTIHSLRSLRNGDTHLLLVFSSPFCDSCVLLASNLVRWMQEMEGLPRVILINSGTAQDNAMKLRGFEPSRILLQHNQEVSDAYDADMTPTAVLVGADGVIRSGLAVGGDAIRKLLTAYAHGGVSEAQQSSGAEHLP